MVCVGGELPMVQFCAMVERGGRYCGHFVHPHIMYGIEIYGNTSNVHLKKLITLNNKLLRILQNKPNKFHINDLYLNSDTLAIPELHTRQLLILVHKNHH